MSAAARGAESRQEFLMRYFEALGAGGEFEQFFTEDVTWTNVESGERFEGRSAVREYLLALHGSMFDARPHGGQLSVTDEHAYLEGEFRGTSVDVRVPFCVVYDFGGEGISAMRLYLSFAALEPLRPRT
ncbi:nuclear transport factor 2 family protein [Kineococcus rubinsiae]|uniref:nuclear transport factor 2 family protein n=1 Tax=Kineococcus rubinsiae TaxID=2609562 RepID=UPI00143118FE|nr:nuclear transport factor 2 family protein [Kineococcus rubinsiae]